MKFAFKSFLFVVFALLALVLVAQGIKLYQQNQSTVSQVTKSAQKYGAEAQKVVVESYKTVEGAVKK